MSEPTSTAGSGPTFVTVPDAAAALGTDVLKVRDLVSDGSLLAVRGDDGVLRIPVDFVSTGVVLKGLTGIVTTLRDNGWSEPEVLRWLYTEDDSLPGTPVAALLADRRSEVARRAQALAW